MKHMRTATGVLALWLAACGTAISIGADGGQPQGETDAGVVETQTDAGSDTNIDAGVPDAGQSDGGAPSDAGEVPAWFTVEMLPALQTGSDGYTAEYEVDLTGEHESFMITSVAPGSNTSLQVLELTNPQGVVLSTGEDHFKHKSRSVAAFGAQAALALESADHDALFVPGRYTFKVKAGETQSVFTPATPQAGVPLEVTVVKKPVVPANARHVLDINLFFTGAAGVDAAAARTNERVQTALTQLRQLYGQMEIEIGAVRYFDTPPGYDLPGPLLPSGGGGKPSIPEVFRLSKGAPTGLNFFFVEELDPFGFGSLFAVLGISGGIPGPTVTQGTDRSGVVVLFDAATWTPKTVGGQQVSDDYLGVVMAHEGGHFLGLSHTYEVFGGASDNLSDTPAQNQTTANDYLMQPSATGNGGLISPLQGKTTRRNPLLRTEP